MQGMQGNSFLILIFHVHVEATCCAGWKGNHLCGHLSMEDQDGHLKGDVGDADQ